MVQHHYQSFVQLFDWLFDWVLVICFEMDCEMDWATDCEMEMAFDDDVNVCVREVLHATPGDFYLTEYSASEHYRNHDGSCR